MQTQTITRKHREATKKKIFSIVEKLEPLELSSLEHYAEYLAQRNNDLKFLEKLKNAKIEDEELSEKTIENLKAADEDIKHGRYRDFEDYAKEHNLQ